jgi:type IX secretion system PorP/SprF family membrane protein
MKKLFTKIAIIIASSTGIAVAQQDPQFTQWMNNKLIYNPGYAGTSGGMCGALQFRQQWASFVGAPVTITFAGDAKLQNLPIGVGLTFINDKIGPMSTNYVRAAGSWINKIGKGSLGIGLDVGILQKSINATWIVPEPYKVDNTIPGVYDGGTNGNLNTASFDVGFGAFYNIPGKFYAGLSTSHIPAQTLNGTGAGNVNFKVTRHYYLMTGYTFNLDPVGRHTLTPNVKYKSDLAAGALDLNLMYAFSINASKFSIGPTVRVNDAAAILLGYQTTVKGTTTFKGGLSYDFVLSKIKGYTSGTYELFLGACFTPKPRTVTRYETDRYY